MQRLTILDVANCFSVLKHLVPGVNILTGEVGRCQNVDAKKVYPP